MDGILLTELGADEVGAPAEERDDGITIRILCIPVHIIYHLGKCN